MRTIGIIAEYNPFHNGHLHQIRQIRQTYGQDTALIAVMSGNWVQRGEPAIMNKQERAKNALQAGINLVLELPTLFATASAGYFAAGAVDLLAATGVCNHLCFGSESGELEPLQSIADLLIEESTKLSSLLQAQLSSGLNSGAAWSKALQIYVAEQDGPQPVQPEEINNILSGSNNWLGIEYLKAIAQRTEGKMKATTFKREGDSYDSTVLHSSSPSAQAVRKVCATRTASSQTADLLNTLARILPATTVATIMTNRQRGTLLTEGAAGLLAYSKLLTTPTEEIALSDNCGSELANRLKQVAQGLNFAHTKVTANDYWQTIVNKVAGRNFTVSRVQRVLTALLLNISAEERARAGAVGPAYIRVLGFDKKGRYLLKLMRRYARLPIISRESDFREFSDADTNFQAQYRLDAAATAMYRSLCHLSPATDFDTNVVIL